MFDKRDIRYDLFALALLVLVALLSFSLLTHDTADPPVALAYPLSELYQMDTLVYPTNETTSNLCGRWGSLAAAMLLDSLGLGAYFLVGSLAVVTALMLMRREIDSPIVRTIGWSASLVGFVTLAGMLSPWSAPGTVMGAGGCLGALGSGLLQFHFARVGGLIFASSLFFGGLLLCTDYVLVRLALVLGTLAITVMSRPRLVLPWRRRRATKRRESDVDKEGLSVRIHGKRVSAATMLDDDDSEYEEDGADEEDLIIEDDAEGEYETDDQYEDGEAEEDDAVEDDTEEELEAEPVPVRNAAVRRGASRLRRLTALRMGKRDEEDREEVMSQLEEASQRDDTINYELPSVDLLIESDDFSLEEQVKEVRRKAKILERTFESFGFDVKVKDIETGPVIAQYEVELEAGLRLSKITGLADDLAIALRVPSVRIVAPIPGKNTVGIEVPNEERQLVRLREVMEETNGRVKKMRIPLFLGKDVSGSPLTVDLASLPHLLIAGRTGTGKSVCLNSIIASILMTRRPDEVRMLMIDPKMVELSGYKSLPHLMHPVVTDMRKAEAILAWAVEKMEERYALLARAGVRHVSAYNQLSEEEIMERLEPEDDEQRRAIPLHMPYIVIVADEMADLMMTAGKEVEQHIIRLAQKSRAVGIHLILATQKPTVDVITGLIKSNLPARIAFQVASRTDSRVVLDEMGADKLLGNGDMLFLWPGTSTLLRGQGTYLSDDEINSVVAVASQVEQSFVTELVQLKVEDDNGANNPGELKKRDELYPSAVEVVIREGRGSVSLLQRALGIGYGRAARMIDYMAEDGIVGPYAGSNAREVTTTLDEWARMQGESDTDDPPASQGDDAVNSESDHQPAAKLKPRAKSSRSKIAVAVPFDVADDSEQLDDLSEDELDERNEAVAVTDEAEESDVDDGHMEDATDEEDDGAESEYEDEEYEEDEEDEEYEYVYEDEVAGEDGEFEADDEGEDEHDEDEDEDEAYEYEEDEVDADSHHKAESA